MGLGNSFFYWGSFPYRIEKINIEKHTDFTILFFSVYYNSKYDKDIVLPPPPQSTHPHPPKKNTKKTPQQQQQQQQIKKKRLKSKKKNIHKTLKYMKSIQNNVFGLNE